MACFLRFRVGLGLVFAWLSGGFKELSWDEG